MTNFDTSLEIQAPADQVWRVLLDVERWPEWTSTMTSVEKADPGPLAVGSRAYVRQPKLRPGWWQVTDLDEQQHIFTWVTRSPGLQIAGRHEVARSSNGSRLMLAIQFSGLLGPLLARLYGGLTQQYLATEANGLKHRCEGNVPVA